jgi:serine phosphatase RsbU (regulator of sigma subunit)
MIDTKQGMPPAVAPASERMHCMEVWGGNRQIDRHVEMVGLEAWIFSEPHQRDRAGGDVYYFSSCASGRITRVLLADVSGHGQDASKSAVGLRELMRRNVNIVQPTKFVRAMNQQFAELDKENRFATAVVCSYFLPTGRMTLCNAGHPEPLYRANRNRWSPVSQQSTSDGANDFPLGVVDDADYSQTTLTLAAGDLLLLFSDALTESVDENGELLGSKGLLDLVNRMDCSDPETMVHNLINELQRMDPSNVTTDDATIVLLRGTQTSPSLTDNLLAPLRLLRPVRDRTELDQDNEVEDA